MRFTVLIPAVVCVALLGCDAMVGDVPVPDAESASDAGAQIDSGSPEVDAGPPDAGTPDAGAPIPDAGTSGGLLPPRGASSGGQGGAAPFSGLRQTSGGINYRLIVPASYQPAHPAVLLLVYSGTEGGAQMASNLVAVENVAGMSGFIRAVLDGVDYYDDGAAGAAVLDDVRERYNVDNDRTYLMGESAGTGAALQLGFRLRQSYFAAYWANDVNTNNTPEKTAAQLGFAPWGQVGPGGDFGDAQQIVSAMAGAGYRLPNPAPYAGSGASQHGNTDQFLAAVGWFSGKTR